MVCCLSKSYAHTNNCKDKITCCEKIKKKRKKRKKERTTGKKNTIARVGTNVRVRGFNAGLLA
jgi:hypothetical protein